jgi:mono/diheme cytochrome c family protein
VSRARPLVGVALGAWLAAVPHASALERPESSNVAQNYLLFCGGCHGADGRGVAHRVPPLNGALGRFLRVDGGRELLLRFPGVANSALSDAALAEVMNWCLATFAGPERPAALAPYSAADVRAARASPALNIRRSRAELMRRLGLPDDEAAAY